MNETAFDFLNLPYCRLKEVVGCIDGCHIRCTPPEKTQDMYYNRKCFHSVLLQACCDSRLLFTDFVAGLPGRASDSRLLRFQRYIKILEIYSLFRNVQRNITFSATVVILFCLGLWYHSKTMVLSLKNKEILINLSQLFANISKELLASSKVVLEF